MKEDIWENALKHISVKAFDALLSCGVRSLDGLLRLTPEDMRQAEISNHIQAEIQEIQDELSSYQKTSEVGKQKEEMIEERDDNPLLPIGALCEDKDSGTSIPKNLLDRLSTRGGRILAQKNISTVEQLAELEDEELFDIVGIGRKTVHDILNFQVKTKLQLDNPQSSKADDTADNAEEKRKSPLRIRFCSLESEHWPSDPADWSLLSRNFLELLYKPPLSPNVSQIEFSAVISDLGISYYDLLKLLDVALLPDDTIDLLLSTSVGYLLNTGVSAELVNKLIEYIKQIFDESSNMSLVFNADSVTDIPIFYNINLSLIKELRIHSFECKNISCLFNGKTDLKWFDLNIVSERQILETLGFGYNSFMAINSMWRLKEEAYKLICSISNSLPINDFASFQNITSSFLKSIIEKPYHFTVIMGRLGYLEDRRWTLEELGQKVNLTRERVRQIEKKYFKILEKPTTLERLNLLWLTIDDVLISGGGVCCTSEVADFLKNIWDWKTAPSDEALSSLVSLSPKYEVISTAPARIIMPGHGCVNCQDIGAVFTKIVEDQPNGTLSFYEAKRAMHAFCKEKSCLWVAEVSQFSDGYLHFQDDAIEEILADENTLYTQYAWTQKYGKRRLSLVETILRTSGRAMHFTEVCKELNKDRPEHGKISERSAHAYLTRSPEILLWDRGTFIHKDYVSIPNELIDRISNEITRRLDGGIPYLSVSGIYKLFEAELVDNNIPTESALYSCLRESASSDIICNEYPYLLKKGVYQRLPIQLVLEEFVLEQDDVITHEELRNYAVETLCINEVLFGIHFQNIPNLLRLDRRKYIHLNNLNIDEEKLSPLIEHLRGLLKNTSHVSVIKLFNDKKISCRLMGISTPMLLYSLIDFFYSDQFTIARYPKICFSGQDDHGKRARGVAREVAQYVKEKNTPCSFAELYQYFVDGLGYKPLSIYNTQLYNDIVRYSEGVVVHVETLGWTNEKLYTLEKLASCYLQDRLSAGKLFGLVADLYEYHFDKLPDLPDHICWTATLIGELLLKGGKYRILGTSRNAFVSDPNNFGIVNLDDLLSQILRTKYDGAANIDQFIADMRDMGILKKSLTPGMLKKDGPIIIDRNVVKLARLR